MIKPWEELKKALYSEVLRDMPSTMKLYNECWKIRIGLKDKDKNEMDDYLNYTNYIKNENAVYAITLPSITEWKNYRKKEKIEKRISDLESKNSDKNVYIVLIIIMAIGLLLGVGPNL